MSIIGDFLGAIFGVVKEVAHEGHKLIEEYVAERRFSPGEARAKGRAKMIAFAKEKGEPFDPVSVDDTFKLVKKYVPGFTGTIDELKIGLAKEMGIEDYHIRPDNGPENEEIRDQLFMMVGYKSLDLDRPA